MLKAKQRLTHLQGKGYADLATLEFLNLVHVLRPLIPLLCVVDCDPHGIDIMRTYKHGSKSLGHEANTRIPGLHWLGVTMDDIFLATDHHAQHVEVAEDSQRPECQSSQISQRALSQASRSPAGPMSHATARHKALDSLIQLTPSDRKTVQRIFQSIVGNEGEDEIDFDQDELEQIRELQVMLVLNRKAEIQAIDNMGDLSSWLDHKMAVA